MKKRDRKTENKKWREEKKDFRREKNLFFLMIRNGTLNLWRVCSILKIEQHMGITIEFYLYPYLITN